jgi:hypothetical protein
MERKDKDAEEWHDLAQNVLQENDPDRMADLVQRLVEALDRYSERNKPREKHWVGCCE